MPSFARPRNVHQSSRSNLSLVFHIPIYGPRDLTTSCTKSHSTLTTESPFSMNWLDPPAEPPETATPQDPLAPSESNLNYWAARLTPLHDPTPTYSSGSAADGEEATTADGREVVFVSCNRVGVEEGELSHPSGSLSVGDLSYSQ